MREFFNRKQRPTLEGDRKIEVNLNSGKRLEVIIRWFIDAYPTLKDSSRWGPLSMLPVLALLVNNILYCYTLGAGGESAENSRRDDMSLSPQQCSPTHGIDVSLMQVRSYAVVLFISSVAQLSFAHLCYFACFLF